MNLSWVLVARDGAQSLCHLQAALKAGGLNACAGAASTAVLAWMMASVAPGHGLTCQLPVLCVRWSCIHQDGL